ncbi:hypothetical protein [Streptomyces sp. NPDC001933]|uniref:hypothetical protein n=1 Tax=Streptomyces sp. NPDC001933 TaxID=3364626 RepID=UPI003696D4EC
MRRLRRSHGTGPLAGARSLAAILHRRFRAVRTGAPQGHLALVRGAAGSHPAVEDIVDSTRATLARRVAEGQRRLGMPDSPRLAVAARAWTAFAEEAVTSWPHGGPDAPAELGAFLESSFISLLGALDRPCALPR